MMKHMFAMVSEAPMDLTDIINFDPGITTEEFANNLPDELQVSTLDPRRETPSLWFTIRSADRAVQSQKMARDLKLWI